MHVHVRTRRMFICTRSTLSMIYIMRAVFFFTVSVSTKIPSRSGY